VIDADTDQVVARTDAGGEAGNVRYDPVTAKIYAERLAEGGIEIAALHNPLLRAEPATMYMHVEERGDPVKLAAALHAALSLSKTPFGQTSAPAAPETVNLETAALDKQLGYTGKASGGVYQFAIPRGETLTDGAIAIPVSMAPASRSTSRRPATARRRSPATSY